MAEAGSFITPLDLAVAVDPDTENTPGFLAGAEFGELGADPAAVADRVVVYAKDDGGVSQLFARSDDGTVHQLTPAGGNTLDEAYDQGGAGAGRTITADSGAVVVNNSVADATHALELNRTGATGSGSALRITSGIVSGASGLAFEAIAADPITFTVNGTEFVRISSVGNLGVQMGGVDAPVAIQGVGDIRASTSNTSVGFIELNSSLTDFRVRAVSSSTRNAYMIMRPSLSVIETEFVASTGTSYSNTIFVTAVNFDSTIRLQQNTGAMGFEIASPPGGEGILRTTASDYIAFEPNSTEAGRFEATGEFLVGTTTVGSNFVAFERNQDATTQVAVTNTDAGSSARSRILLTGGTNTFLIDVQNTAAGGISQLTANSDGQFQIGTIQNERLRFFTNSGVAGSNRFHIEPGGDALLGIDGAAGRTLSVGHDQNSGTTVEVRNPTTNGASARAVFGIEAQSGNAEIYVGSDSFSGVGPPDALVLQANMDLAGGVVLLTQDPNPIIFQTDTTERGRVDGNGNWSLTQGAQTGGSPTAFTVTGAVLSALAASTEAPDVDLDLDRNVQFSTGALATQRAVIIRPPTYAFVGASTITTAATVAITGAPVAGTNATITNAFALDVTGATRITGKLTVTGSIDPTDLTLSGGGTAHFIAWGNGTTAGVSAAGTGRIRYNDTTKTFQASVDGGAYADIGGGGGAPANAQYLVLAADGTLTNERVFTPSTGVTVVDGGAGGNYTVTVDLSTGVSGGQDAIGGTAAADSLTLVATTNAVPGEIIFEPTQGTPRVRISDDQVYPESDGTYDLGRADRRFNTLYSTTLNTGDLVMNAPDGSAIYRLRETAEGIDVTEEKSGRKGRLVIAWEDEDA